MLKDIDEEISSINDNEMAFLDPQHDGHDAITQASQHIRATSGGQKGWTTVNNDKNVSKRFSIQIT